MKLKHFLALVSAIAVACVVLIVKACKSSEPPPKPAQIVHEPPPQPPPSDPRPSEVPPVPTSPSSAELPARAHDAEVIAWSKKSISGDKQKDVSKGKPYKINVYKEAGHSSVNRAKVDLDRDDKWDEKYTFEPGKITLQRAPADDERYTETYHWVGSGWAK
jgi:hypothetical protein